MAEKDPTARLRRAVQENNLFLVKRLIQRTDMRNPDPGPRRYTSLAWAAVLGHEETFEYLLANGHDDYEISRDADNNTIVMLLADQKPSGPSQYTSLPGDNVDTMRAGLRMARLYYDRYPKVIDWANVHGKSALHSASEKGNEELVRMLCDLGADFNLADNQGNTPLHYASIWGHIPVVQLLIERGCQYTARNNEGFTASDYAYSFSTRDTLQDTARIQFENNKKSRRAIYQQAASRGHDYSAVPPAASPTPSKARDIYPISSRMRSGSGTSRTTDTSNSGELEGNGLMPGPHSQSSLSASSSPSQPSGMSNHHFHTSQSSSPSPSAPQPPLLHSSSSSSSHSALTPFATRVLERDADAMEKYMRRNRSESQGTNSTDNRSQNGSYSSLGLSANGDHSPQPSSGVSTPKKLRPSASAQQLRSHEPIQGQTHSPLQNEIRSRSGTNPTMARPSAQLALIRSTSISSTSQSLVNTSQSLLEEPERYTGPPSQYAQFPEPPSEEASTPTAGRRMALYQSKSPFSIDSSSHRRGMSAASLRGP